MKLKTGAILWLACMCGFSASGQGNKYYLSSSGGNDVNDGSKASPWSSLEKISSVLLEPGDSVFFRRGDRFDGHFVVNGSGTEGNPVVFTAYGEGEKPLITGEAGEVTGGDYQEAIYIENQDHLTFDGLEVNNERKHTRNGVEDTDAYGIYLYNSGNETMRQFRFRNMTFRNVFAVKEMNDPADFNKLQVAAVRIESARNTVVGKEKNIQDVLMEDCYFEKLQRLGVHVKHRGGKAGVGNDSINRNMNLVFRNNEFHNTGGTCILPTNTYNVLIEHNLFYCPGSSIDPRMPGRGSSVWTWRCRNTVIQYNQCMHIRGYLDSHGVHIDHENRNTFIQYNYMEDCEGGFVEILGGNIHAVYRFNISVNDGWRENPNWKNSNHTIWINEKASGGHIIRCDSTYIYNNTIFIDSAYSTAIDIDAKNTFIYNNIFYAINGASIGGKQVVVKTDDTPLYMSNNLFSGEVNSSFKNLDPSPKFGEPNFRAPGTSGPYGYQLNYPSDAINAGTALKGPAIPGAGSGIFKDLTSYPEVDFFGNPVDLKTGTPNIGACNSKAGDGTSIKQDREYLMNRKFMIYPNPAEDIVYIRSLDKFPEKLKIMIYTQQGTLVQNIDAATKVDEKIFSIKLAEELPPGIYFMVINKSSGRHLIKITSG